MTNPLWRLHRRALVENQWQKMEGKRSICLRLSCFAESGSDEFLPNRKLGDCIRQPGTLTFIERFVARTGTFFTIRPNDQPVRSRPRSRCRDAAPCRTCCQVTCHPPNERIASKVILGWHALTRRSAIKAQEHKLSGGNCRNHCKVVCDSTRMLAHLR
jgi:hypothetical protein